MKASPIRLSPLFLRNGELWGWAYIPGRPVLEVHCYLDGKHVATELTGQHLPADIERACGKSPAAAGYRFVLPPSLHDGFEHTLQIALPEVDGGIYSPLLTTPCAAVRGEIRQQGRQLVGTVWFQSSAKRSGQLRICDAHGNLLMRKTLTPLKTSDVEGFPAAFTVPLNKLATGPLLVSCDGQQLRGSPFAPFGFVIGMVETCDASQITGWAFDALDMRRPIELALRIDGKVVQWFRPNQERSALAKQLGVAERDIGVAGFHVVPPADSRDGNAHLVEVVAAGTGQLLEHGQRHVTWSPAHVRFDASPSVRTAKKKTVKFPAPVVSVIILNRNGAGVLESFLHSWQQHNRTLPAELIIIDHASSDASIAMLKRWRGLLDLHIVALNHNDSFSASCNLGATLAKSSLLLFLNNDIQWLHDALPIMVNSLHDTSVGIVGMKLLKVVGESLSGKSKLVAKEVQHLGVRFTINELGYWPYELTPTENEAEYSAQSVPVVTGAALLCRKADFDKAGGFHPDYFYGFEDVEFCLRFSERLRKSVICRNDCVALHHHGHTRLSGRERIFDRLRHNSTVLESHIGPWIKQKWWRSLISGDGHFTREALKIGLVGNASRLAPSLASAHPSAHIELIATTHDWKQVEGFHLLIVGDPGYDIRSLRAARSDLCTVAWVQGAVKEWNELAWWLDFDTVLAPSASAAKLQKALKTHVYASTRAQPLGELLSLEKIRLRVCIMMDEKNKPAVQAAGKLRQSLRQAGVSCWMQDVAKPQLRMADACVRLGSGNTRSRISVSVASGMLQVEWPLSQPAPSAQWLATELEKQVGSTFCAS